MEKYIEFWINNKFFVLLFIIFIVLGGLLVAPFDWRSQFIERYPIAVDAIPDISENQQIVFTQWPGRSPADVDDQISYPLTVSLLGLPGVKTIRSYSNFGFSMIYVIFEENIEFYWSRSRILEKLNSLPPGSLPQDAIPSLGPDATALGQVFWYTLEGRDKQGNPAGGWDLEELRSIQDWNVKYSLMSAAGVSEVASVGGFIREYQIDVNPDAMRAYGVSIQQVFDSILMSSSDVSGRTIEVNNVEYMIRGVGFIDKIEDLETIAVTSRNNTPVRIQDLAHITLGPALRRGVLDKGGAEAVGGVAVVRYGDNPLQVINNIKEKIALIAPGLPEKTLEDGTLSKVTIVPFYDRTELIYETLNTLNDAISQQILITLIVILFLVFNLRTSFIIGLMLPLTVFLTFLLMKFFNVDANIVALSGIAIAVGTIVDMGIVFCENILRHYKEHPHTKDTRKLVSKASLEVASAVLTAALTTIVSFIPVFTMTGAEGKLFTPLAFTKTFALISAIILAITLLPAVAHLVYGREGRVKLYQGLAIVLALLVAFFFLAFNEILFGCLIAALALITIFEKQLQRLFSSKLKNAPPKIFNLVILFITISLLSRYWEPLGPEYSTYINWIFVVCLLAVIFLFILFFQRYYSPMLAGCITHPKLTLSASAMIVAFGFLCWQGYSGNNPWLARSFPGLGKEFMPALDEGAFLYMPTTMPHAGVSEVTDVLHKQNSALSAIPEVENVVGKLGRADSALDSAPISMIETIINYHPEYAPGQETQRGLFQYDEIKNTYLRDHLGNLIEDPEGRPYRNWRPHIKNPDDIWQEIVKVAQIPGTTSAPKLQPIETRIVMLQSGFRAPMGIKVFGPDLDSIERFSQDLEQQLKQVSTIKPETVFAERIVGKPYLEIHINRERISRYGIQLKSVQNVIEVAIGGKQITTTVEGRERYPIRVRYMRELRDSIESLGDILIASPDGVQIPLRELAEIKYIRGPQVIKSEDTFLVGYIIFDKQSEYSEVTAVKHADTFLKEKITAGELDLPSGVSYKFSGSYENQVRASKTLTLVLPVSLALIFVLLFLQFRSIATSLIVFYSVFLAWSGGFILLWLYGKPWFLNIELFELNFRDLFNIQPFNLSIAVWVGFLALFGIATDNGVILATRLQQQITLDKPKDQTALRQSIILASQTRVRACLLTTATTLIALLPIFTSQGRGSDIMIPMAIPSMGGMLVILITLFVIPILYYGKARRDLLR